jgi:hypothetical protein
MGEPQHPLEKRTNLKMDKLIDATKMRDRPGVSEH